MCQHMYLVRLGRVLRLSTKFVERYVQRSGYPLRAVQPQGRTPEEVLDGLDADPSRYGEFSFALRFVPRDPSLYQFDVHN